MIATLIMPPVTFLVPSYVMMARLGLIDTSAPLVLLWAATAVPGTIFLLSALMRSIPDEILEAARIDGAGYFEMLFRIALPAERAGHRDRDDLQHHRLVERSAAAAGAHRRPGQDDA